MRRGSRTSARRSRSDLVGVWALALAAAGFWSGTLWATGGSGSLGPRVSVLALCAGCIVVCATALAGSRRLMILLFALVAVSFGLLGAGLAGMRDASVRASPIAALAGRSVTIVGTLASSAEQGMFGWTAASRAQSVRSKLHSSSDVGSAGSIWLQGGGERPDFPAGQQIVVRGTVRRLRGPFGGYLRRRGFAAVLDVVDLEDAGPPRNPVVRLANSVRGSLRRSLTRVFPPKDAGLLMGLALGDTSTLDRRVEEDFRASGLSHLTAVSGQNLVMFLAPILGLAGLAGVGRRARFLVGLSAVGFFVLLTGAEPSVLRASAMSGLTLLGVFLGRPRSPPAILGGAVLLLLAHDPTLVHSVGFQLSVAATVGMAILAQPVGDRLGALPRPLALAAGTTLAAQAGVMPVLLFYFQVFPIVSIPANLLAFPAVGPAMLLGLASGGLELV
ncbi:MAG: ComEC/Rec2 family competence protein, partial [Actinomycetota bacterium]